MFNYYLRLALRSLGKNRMLSALMVVAIGLGIGASMTTYSAFRAVSRDPIPSKSAQLFVPQLDMWGPKGRDADGEPPSAFDYTDAMALLHAHAAKRQTVVYPVGFPLLPEDTSQKPFDVQGHAVFTDFFAMTEAPFRSGSAWNTADDEARAQVVVIGRKLNDRLYGQQSGVGRTIRLNGQDFRIVGVLKAWNPQPRFFDLGDAQAFDDPEDVFIPFNWAIDHQVDTNGNRNCQTDPGVGWDAFLHSSCVWMSLLVELPTTKDVAAYREFLDGYAHEQQRLGRFDWAPNNRLRNVMQWLEFNHVVPDTIRVQMLIAFAFLLVCLVNVIGLMLAKFLRRSWEIGVRRALGASKREIYAQFFVEAGVVGMAGGIVGFGLTALGRLGLLSLLDPDIADLVHFDPELMVVTLALSLTAALAAGLYPAIRAAGVRPAWQLKSN